jgi:PBP1b-binding outer membrane lipoprotein LpoB
MKPLLAVIALILTLSGCQGATKTEPDPAPAPTQASTDEVFAQYVRDNIPLFSTSPDADIVELGHTICEAFDSGMSFEDILATGDAADWTAMSQVIGASIAAYCPEHSVELET